MIARIADPRMLRWFHLFPLVAGVEAILWLIVASFYPWAFGANRWYQPAVWMLLVAFGISVLTAFVCRNRAGLSAALATWLLLIWGKDASLWNSNSSSATGNTGLSGADKLVLLAVAVALGYSAWDFGVAWDATYVASAELAAAAIFVLAFFPGVRSASLEQWDLRPVASDDDRTTKLIETLRRRIGSPRDYRARPEDDSSDVALGTIAIDTPDAVLDTVRRAADSAKGTDDHVTCDYSVSLVRTPIAMDAASLTIEPQVIGIEKITLAINSSRLDGLRQKNRSQPLAFRQSLDDHVVHSRSDEIFHLCVALEALFRKYQLSPWDRLQTILGFCQEPNIRYVLDESDESTHDLGGSRIGDYCRYPLETLVDRQGDCDCHSALAACLFYTLGYDCCVFSIQSKVKDSLHMAVGVLPPGANVLLPDAISLRIGSQHYYYCETTGSWQIGRVPGDMDAETIKLWWPRRS